MSLRRVWAPAARTLTLEVGGRSLPLRKEDAGWWSLALDERLAREPYAFRVDGGPPLADPRAGSLPQGLGGPAQAVDPHAFHWTDAGFRPVPLASAAIYELHVGTFSEAGTFDGAIPHLDALRELGITHVELMPVNAFPGHHGWGYDGAGLYAPHVPYGGPAGLQRFVDAAHARGLAVLLDVVYNHLGPTGNVLGQFGPYFTDRHHTPWGEALNLDGPRSDGVRRFLCDNALQWLRDYHVDGLRLDAVHALFDQSARPFLAQLRDEVDALSAHLGRPLVLIAESDLNDPRHVSPRTQNGFGLDAQWNDDFHHALHAALTGERHGYYADFGSLPDLAHAFEHGFVYDGRYSRCRDRHHGAPVRSLSGHRFVVYLQNHDQVGNRAHGERTSQLLSSGRLQIGAALTLLSPFVPLLFQGEEWGAGTPFLYFTDHADPGLAEAVREGRRRELGARLAGGEPPPDPQAPETFQRSRLDWKERERAPHRELLEWHRSLLALRRSHPAFTDGALDAVRCRFDEEARWLCLAHGPFRVACNLAPGPREIPLEGRGRILLANHPVGSECEERLILPPDGVCVVELTSAHGS